VAKKLEGNKAIGTKGYLALKFGSAFEGIQRQHLEACLIMRLF